VFYRATNLSKAFGVRKEKHGAEVTLGWHVVESRGNLLTNKWMIGELSEDQRKR